METAQRLLLNYLSWAGDFSSGLTPGEALGRLVESVLYELQPLQGSTEIAEHLEVLYRLRFSEAEVDNSLTVLNAGGRISRGSSGWVLALHVREEIRARAVEPTERQERVLSKWRNELLERYPTLDAQELDYLAEDLMAFLRQLCSRHGTETALLLYPDNPEARSLMESAAESREDLPTRAEALISIRQVELPRFLESQDKDRRLLLADLLNAWAVLSVLTVDPRAADIIREVTTGQVIYADTNFVYCLLNLQGPLNFSAARELVQLARKLGYRLKATPWTVAEFRHSLSRAQDFLRKNPLLPADLEQVALETSIAENFISAYWRAHRQNSTSIEDFFAFYANLEDLLLEEGVEVVADGCHAVDANKAAIDEQVSIIDSLLWSERHPVVKEHDAKHRLLIRRLRGQPRTRFGNAGFLYLTHDSLMPRYDVQAQKREGITELPFAILASAFLQILRLLVPRTEDLDLALADIITSPYLRNIGKLDPKTTAQVLGRVAQYEGYTPQLAVKVLMDRVFIETIERAPKHEDTMQIIDDGIVRAAKGLAADVERLREEFSEQRHQLQETKQEVEQMKAARREAEELLRRAQERESKQLQEAQRLRLDAEDRAEAMERKANGLARKGRSLKLGFLVLITMGLGIGAVVIWNQMSPGWGRTFALFGVAAAEGAVAGLLFGWNHVKGTVILSEGIIGFLLLLHQLQTK